MNIHNVYIPRLKAQQKEQENAAMAELEQRSAPLFWMVFVAVGLIATGLLTDHVERYLELAADQEALVQCINGKAIFLDDEVLHCNVKQFQLVAGVKS